MFDVITLGIAAGIIQAIGYMDYIRRSEIEPNPVTWFMFSYGTLILTILEWETMMSMEMDFKAALAIIFLPMTCTILGWVVMFRCWVHARRIERLRGETRLIPAGLWPKTRLEKGSFYADVGITVLYLILKVLESWGILDDSGNDWVANAYVWKVALLVSSNLTTFTAFVPIIESTHKDPGHEHYAPWVWWTAAYGILGLGTYLETGFWSDTMLYPVTNMLTHGLIGWLARPSAQHRHTIRLIAGE